MIKKIFLTLYISTAILVPSVFAQADCVWKSQLTTTNPELGTSQTTGGCASNEHQAGGGNEVCSGTKPAISSNGFTTTNYLCCCGSTTVSNNTTEAPKFKIPELQIDLPGLTMTQPNCTQGDDGSYSCKVNWLGEYLTWIYNYALKIIGILAAVMLMAGGVLWLISGGDAGKVGQAKEIIVGSITGLIILMSSYLILVQVNPELVKMNSISLGALRDQEIKDLIKTKNSSNAKLYHDATCATDQELTNGVSFYATGYCRPAWVDSKRFFCLIAMNCSCPNGSDTSQNCDEYFPNFPNYHPCTRFESNTEYCNKTANGSSPFIGSVAGPVGTGAGKCNANLKFGDQVCFKGKTYLINDTGSAITGKRLDIWTGDCSLANSVTGSGILTKGPCPAK